MDSVIGRARSAMAALLIGLAMWLVPLAADAAEADFAVANGWFYTQAGAAPGSGFAITNDGGVAFWRDYQRLGGPTTLGFPSSWRFVGADGYIYQSTQGALLQWRPDDDRAVLANSFDMLSNANHDEWLRVARQVPPPVVDDGSKGDPVAAAAIRLSWLEDEGIRQRYLANPNPAEFKEWSLQRATELYGLPTSRPQRIGPFVVQRFQRVALQRWVELVPGMPRPGTVVRVLGGDLLKEAGLLPHVSIAAAPAGSPQARIDPELRARLDLLASLPVAKPLYDLALQRPVAVVWAPLPPDIGGMYSARRRWIAINVRWHDSDPRAIAALLSHELNHVRDFYSEKPIWTNAGCLETEQSAFKMQGTVWEGFYGPAGKSGVDVSEIDRQQNFVLSAQRRDPDSFASRIVQAYERECGAGQVR